MAYCDYEFYKTKYYGNLIAEADFDRLASRASEKLDSITFHRLCVTDGNIISVDYTASGATYFPLLEDIADRVKKCVCAIAEKMNDVEISNNTIRANGGGNVSSVSSGSESISFKSSVTITESERHLLYYKIAREYLSGTGLLYAGF